MPIKGEKAIKNALVIRVISILTSTSEDSLKKLSSVPCCKTISRGRCSWRITDHGKLGSLIFFILPFYLEPNIAFTWSSMKETKQRELHAKSEILFKRVSIDG